MAINKNHPKATIRVCGLLFRSVRMSGTYAPKRGGSLLRPRGMELAHICVIDEILYVDSLLMSSNDLLRVV